MKLRWYQSEAVDACWQYLCTQAGNPVCVLPTGAGKSIVIAQLCKDAVEKYNGRVLVLQHRKELIEQNADKIKRLIPNIDVGIYSSGLRRWQADNSVVLAGIQSAYKYAFDFGQRHLVIIDESHLVPFDGEGMYQKFLADLRTANPRLRVVGTTATPYRLDCGPLCRLDGIFQKVAYSASIQRLIADGYLCNLTSKMATASANTSGLHLRGGEFIHGEMEREFSRTAIVITACMEIVEKTHDRRSVLIFCAGVEHARIIAHTIEKMTSERVGLVTGETPPLIRDGLLTDFKNRHLRFLCNCDVLTTGFDAPCIDAIAVLRATMSPGLFAQMVGRGFRIHPAKADCLVLDFGGNLERHGPIDSENYGKNERSGESVGEAPTKTCPNCGLTVYAGVRECQCGFTFPIERQSHSVEADQDHQILAVPQKWVVEAISYHEHYKAKRPNDPPTLRVDYACIPLDSTGGNLEQKTFSEWVCIEHNGFAQRKAFQWWKKHSKAPFPNTVEEACSLCNRGAVASASAITTLKDGHWDRVINHTLDEIPETWHEEEIENVFEDCPF
jgi:DNA repair protein RadD